MRQEARRVLADIKSRDLQKERPYYFNEMLQLEAAILGLVTEVAHYFDAHTYTKLDNMIRSILATLNNPEGLQLFDYDALTYEEIHGEFRKEFITKTNSSYAEIQERCDLEINSIQAIL